MSWAPSSSCAVTMPSETLRTPSAAPAALCALERMMAPSKSGACSMMTPLLTGVASRLSARSSVASVSAVARMRSVPELTSNVSMLASSLT